MLLWSFTQRQEDNRISSLYAEILVQGIKPTKSEESYTWDGFIAMLKVYPLAKPKIYVRLF